MIRLLFLAIILSVLSSNAEPVTIQDVELKCHRQKTATVKCELPSDVKIENQAEVTSTVSNNPRLTSDSQVKDATEVTFKADFLPFRMPFGIGRHFHRLQKLWMVKSRLRRVEKKNFENMQDVRQLFLYENEIDSIPVDAFENLAVLEYLDIDKNLISTLEADLLLQQMELLVFRASYNGILVIPAGFFKSNWKLKEIYLDNNEIVKIDVDFSEFKDLTVVDLNGNENGCDFGAVYDETLDGSRFDVIMTLQYKVELFCRDKQVEN